MGKVVIQRVPRYVSNRHEVGGSHTLSWKHSECKRFEAASLLQFSGFWLSNGYSA